MKKFIQLFIVLFLSVLSLKAISAEITSVTIDPKEIEAGQKFDVLINFKKEANEKVSCGIDLTMEEGKVNNINIKDMESPLRFSYQYDAAGTYQIILKPKAHLDGWKLIPFCDGNTQTLSIKVTKNEGVQVDKVSLDTSVIHNDAKANASARELVLSAMRKDVSNQEKVKLYFDALKIQANYVPALLGLALVRENQGKFDSAVKGLHLARSFLKEGPLADAVDMELIALNQSSHKKENKNPPVDSYGNMINKARMHLATNQITEAVNALNQARTKDSKRWEAYILAGQIAYASDLKEDAQILINAGLMRIKDTGLRQKISSANEEIIK